MSTMTTAVLEASQVISVSNPGFYLPPPVAESVCERAVNVKVAG
ncbi:MAG: hypothetical protein CM1200mP29_09580 [Verrucomicrobiota bacterium]|nr:MAG: hypothetical protein CM1200mP29_09580 [Verrucomicrobiota bacterium]